MLRLGSSGPRHGRQGVDVMAMRDSRIGLFRTGMVTLPGGSGHGGGAVLAQNAAPKAKPRNANCPVTRGARPPKGGAQGTWGGAFPRGRTWLPLLLLPPAAAPGNRLGEWVAGPPLGPEPRRPMAWTPGNLSLHPQANSPPTTRRWRPRNYPSKARHPMPRRVLLIPTKKDRLEQGLRGADRRPPKGEGELAEYLQGQGATPCSRSTLPGPGGAQPLSFGRCSSHEAAD